MGQPKASGSALISALFIMTLVAIAATAMTTRLQIDIYRTRLLLTHDRLDLASQAVIVWGMGELKNRKKPFFLEKDGSIANLPEKVKALYPDISLAGKLFDLQAKMNVNSLTDKKSFPTFLNLLELIFPEMPPAKQKELLLAINDWISDYRPEHGRDDYLSFYLKRGYHPAHQLMASLSELALVKGVNPLIFQNLTPFIVVLPEKTPININTASKLVLRSLGNGLSTNQVNELLETRSKKSASNPAEINKLLQKFSIPPEQVSTESKYFLCVASARYQNGDVIFYGVLKKTTNKESTSVQLISLSRSLW